MDPRRRGDVVVAAIVVASVASIYFWGLPTGFPTMSYEIKPQATNVEGEILSIEKVGGGDGAERKEAVVRLPSGQTVRAYVPPACLVFPGQIAQMSHYGLGQSFGAMYVISGSKEKKGE